MDGTKLLHNIDITICIPYFERFQRLQKTLSSFHDCGYFAGYPYRIGLSICDDGSIKEPLSLRVFDKTPIILTQLPPKKEWLNPCIPINRAVRASQSPLILLQSPETYHPMSVIAQMAQLMTDYRNVVLCPTRVEGHKGMEWYAHPKHRPVKYWFCQLMSRDFFEEIGGFDELYRWGQGFDDDYFAAAIERAGGKFLWVGDCHVVHVKEHRQHRMPSIEANRKRFDSDIK